MTIHEDLHHNGYAIVEDLFTPEELKEMKREIEGIVEREDMDKHPKTVFSTYDEDKHAMDDYFLNSSDKIRFFFEEGAIDKEGKLVVDKGKAFNKVGHALHWENAVFKKYSFHPKMKQIFKDIKFEEPEIVQSMYIFKQSRIGGAVTDHFDATFLNVDPIDNLIGIWIAVDDSTIENGCLSFIPGSHKKTSVDYRFIRTNCTDGGPLLKFEGEKPVYDQQKFVAAPIKKGSAILIHGLVVHKSEANTSSHSRHAYTMHVMERKNTKWNPTNWLQETDTYKFPNLYNN